MSSLKIGKTEGSVRFTITMGVAVAKKGWFKEKSEILYSFTNCY